MMLPSEWTEQNVIMQKPFPGPFRYTRTPYTREIIDCLAPDNPVQHIVVMKGAQIGFSSGVIYPGIGWIIKQNPGNTMLSVGAPDLIDKSMEKVDLMIDAAGLREYIKPQVKRRRNQKSGDTNQKKDFANGFLIVTSANNHKNIRQIDLQYQFRDDYEALKQSSKESGNTGKKLDQRSAAYAETKKTFDISTPERKENSNIEPAYLLGDQRKYFIPCPCCGAYITLDWATPSKKTPDKMCGIYWDLDEDGMIKEGSVGYRCQECDEVFDDKRKQEWLNLGEWRPTAKPKKKRYRSYHISALYAPIGMDDWEKYVGDYIEANPVGQPRVEDKWQTFVNEVLGETYEASGTAIESKNIVINNCREYTSGSIPELMSIKDGNGKIVLITCAADLGGLVAGINSDHDDVRLDFEVVGHAESGARYSLMQDSIGTFTPAHMGKRDESREVWSYDLAKPNNVWKEFDKILATVFVTDTGRKMSIQMTGIDTGFAEHQAFSYIDRRVGRFNIVGLKGDKEHKYIPFGDNSPSFKQGQSRSNLYILKVGKIKDRLAQLLALKWNKHNGEQQPPGFMNFPLPEGKRYSIEHFFAHYESEERKLDKDKNFIWQKKTTVSQNHFWDCAVYNTELPLITMNRLFKELKLDVKTSTWQDFCHILTGRK